MHSSHLSLLAISIAIASGASAQQAPSSDSPVLKTVVVTGEKITRDLQQTTSSVAVVDAEQIERFGLQNLTDAYRMMANVRDADWVDAGFIVRGVNSDGIGGPAGRPLATYYVDGVAQTQQAARRGPLGMWDVKQVEVMRGPQSTTSGRNALAGGIRVETNDPTYNPEAALRVTRGSLDTSGYALMASAPVVDDVLAVRIAAERAHSFGGIDYPFYDDMPRLDEREDSDYWQARGKVLFQPQGRDGLTFLLSHARSYDSPAYNDVDGPLAGVDYFDRQWGVQVPADSSEARSTASGSTALKITQPFGDELTFTSLTTYTDSNTSRPSVSRSVRGEFDETETAQEFRLNYSSKELSWVGGIYGNRTRNDDFRNDLRSYEAPVERQSSSESDIDNYAVFGEVDLKVAAHLRLIAGARYDYEKQDFDTAFRRYNTSTGVVTSASGSAGDTSYGAWLPKLGVVYELDAKSNIGFVVQRAYRAGGAAFNTVTAESYEYDPEYAWNYEISYRSQWLDDRLRLNANLFYLDWKDQQINVPQVPNDFTSDITLNAGKSHVSGGEIELSVEPVTGLDVFASIGIAKTKFEDFEFLQNGVLVDMKGEAFPQSPEKTAALGADYQHGSGWFVGGDLKYTDSTQSQSELQGASAFTLPSYTLVNLHAGYSAEHWRVTAWSNNATDKEYFLYRSDGYGADVASVGRQRVSGVTLDLTY